MDPSRFDRLARGFAETGTRRGALAALAGVAALPLLAGPESALAKKHKKKCKNGLKRCHKEGVDTKTDSANCGTCGTVCAGPQTCGGGGTPGVCGCTKATCQAGMCGSPSDGCGGTLNCGGCSSPNSCGGGGTPNVCGCLGEGTVTDWSNRAACCGGSCCADQPDPVTCTCSTGCG